MPIKPTNENSHLVEQILNQAVDSINLLTQTATRLEERNKIIAEKQSDLESKIEKGIENYHQTSNRLTAIETKNIPDDISSIKDHLRAIDLHYKDLEKRLDKVENNHEKSESRIFFFLDAVWKIVLMCITGYILFKLGIQAPPS